MLKAIFFLLVLNISVIAQEESENSLCNCKEADLSLRQMIENGKIDQLFLSDINNGEYQNWSTSMLCPSSRPPLKENREGQNEKAFEEWTCRYSAYNLMDESSVTAWSEGVEGDGVGEIVLSRINIQDTMKIWAGYGKSEKIFYANNRPKEICLYYFITKDIPEGTQYGVGFRNIKLVDKQNFTLNDYNGFQFLPTLRMPIEVIEVQDSFIAIEILSVYKGNKYDDTCITEISN